MALDRIRHRHAFYGHGTIPGITALLVPDGDLFRAVRDRRASVVDNQIDTFTQSGIKLKDGSELEADIIVTATGLNLQVLAGSSQPSMAGVDFAKTLNIQGIMYSDLPKYGLRLGIPTRHGRECDLTCEYVCRLITTWTGTATSNACRTISIHDIGIAVAGFLVRLRATLDREMPKQGRAAVAGSTDYALDIVTLRYGKVDDGVMRYS